MYIFDAHCDVLSKLLDNPGLDFARGREGLDVTAERMAEAGYGAQNFAVYLPERLAGDFRYVLESIDLFHERVLKEPRMRFVRTKNDLRLARDEGRIGALLSLEGVDSLQGSLAYVRILHHLGVRSVGITWNRANWAADGVLEPRGGGFTAAGKRLIEECNRLGLVLDASHLSDRSFWELAETSAKPVIASHSNARAIAPRARNLTDDQIVSIARGGGVIGLTFVPAFASANDPVRMEDLLPHLDRVCALGGTRRVGFGSDFDGIGQWIAGLEHAGRYDRLVNLLLKHYREEDVERFVYRNWFDFYSDHLPD